jgi:hypothetical protein
MLDFLWLVEKVRLSSSGRCVQRLNHKRNKIYETINSSTAVARVVLAGVGSNPRDQRAALHLQYS